MARYIISLLIITLFCNAFAFADEPQIDVSLKKVTGGTVTYIDKNNQEVTFSFKGAQEEDYISVYENDKYLSGLNYGPYLIKGKAQENDYYKFLQADKVTVDDAKVIVIKALIDIFRQKETGPIYDISKLGYSYDKNKKPSLSCSDILLNGKIYEELGREKYIDDVANTSYYAFRNRALEKAKYVFDEHMKENIDGINDGTLEQLYYENTFFTVLAEYAGNGFYNLDYLQSLFEDIFTDSSIKITDLRKYLLYFNLQDLYPNETDILLDMLTTLIPLKDENAPIKVLDMVSENHKFSYDMIAFTKGYFDIYNDGMYEMVQVSNIHEYSVLNILELIPDSKYSNLYPRFYKLINNQSDISDTLNYKPLHCTDNVYNGDLYIFPYNHAVYIINTSKIDNKLLKIEARNSFFFKTEYGNNYTIDPLINQAGGDKELEKKNIALHQVSYMGTFALKNNNDADINGYVLEREIAKEPMSPLGDLEKIIDARGEKIAPQYMKVNYKISKFDSSNADKVVKEIDEYIDYLAKVVERSFPDERTFYFYDISTNEKDKIFLATIYDEATGIEYLFPVMGKNLKVMDKKLSQEIMKTIRNGFYKGSIVHKTDKDVYIGYISGDNKILVVNIVDGKAGYNSSPIYNYKDVKEVINENVAGTIDTQFYKLDNLAGVTCDEDFAKDSILCTDRSLLSAVAYIKSLYRLKSTRAEKYYYPVTVTNAINSVYNNFEETLRNECSSSKSYDDCMNAILSYEDIFKY